MPDQLILIFSREKIQELMDKNPDKIVVRTTIEEGRLDTGESVGYVKVIADAVITGSPEPLHTVTGCPVPPCDEN